MSPPRLLRGGSGLTARIRPVAEITAERPTCDMCCWVARGFMSFEIKVISRACPLHGRAECE